jgi:hypothetical protein
MVMNRDELKKRIAQTTFQRFSPTLPVKLCETLVTRLTTQE